MAWRRELGEGAIAPVLRRRGRGVVFRAAVLAVLVALPFGCADQPPPAEPQQTQAAGPALARRQMVAAAHPLAAEAGLRILHAGGSATDAAIAAQMVLNLVEPQSSGIGGGGFLMHFRARDARLDAYDGRETAPRSARAEMFLDARGRPRPFAEAALGGLAVGVPGLLRMLEAAHAEHGRLPWAELFAPAIALANEGFPVSPRLAEAVAQAKPLKAFPAARAYFFTPDGRPLQAGQRLTNPAFAATLRRIAAGGAGAFYKGETAGAIVRAVRTAPLNAGRLSEADLASYQAVRRDAVCGAYRSYRVCGMPPPSAGGITTLQILGLLEPFGSADVAPGALVPVHRFAEASKLAFADRDAYIADPDFVPVPTEGLLDDGYLKGRSKLIGERAVFRAQPGRPPGPPLQAETEPEVAGRGLTTTHLTIVDADGNAVAMTTSIEQAFGSHLMVGGFLLNNQLTDFSFVPANGGEPLPNRAAPGKRPRSAMAPTLVFDADGRLALGLGSPGGSRIIDYVAQTVIGVIDGRHDIQAAIDQPRVANRNGPTELEAGTPLEALKPALEALGHTVVIRELDSGLNAVAVTAAGLAGGADRRREGVAMGD
jgi:gamma-glutamyltranspeptidase/glutathione hydrolase